MILILFEFITRSILLISLREFNLNSLSIIFWILSYQNRSANKNYTTV
jgi:hypothetical protein